MADQTLIKQSVQSASLLEVHPRVGARWIDEGLLWAITWGPPSYSTPGDRKVQARAIAKKAISKGSTMEARQAGDSLSLESLLIVEQPHIRYALCVRNM